MKTMLVHSKVAAEVPVGVFAVTLSVIHNPGCQEKKIKSLAFYFFLIYLFYISLVCWFLFTDFPDLIFFTCRLITVCVVWLENTNLINGR